MTEEIIVRAATRADHPTFAALLPELGVDDPLPSEETFAREMMPRSLVAEVGGVPAGIAMFTPMTESWHLNVLITAPAMRRRGVGRVLSGAIVARARAAGARTLSLNVKPENHGAIALYESMGLARVFESRSLRLPWAVVRAWSAAETPYADDARILDTADDARVEHTLGLSRGALAAVRKKKTPHVLVAIEHGPTELAVAAFNPAAPGAHPFRATSEPSAFSLLRALERHAHAEHDFTNVHLEDAAAVSDALLRAGATLRLSIVAMRGAI